MWYQITQFNRPLNILGNVTYYNAEYTKSNTARITQAHLECDTAKTSHIGDQLLLDFNRAGTPLIEVVTEPDFHSADDVISFIKELQRTLMYYGISEAQMDKGQMRCDINISISSNASLGTKIEIKNMNTLSGIKRAIEYEYARQSAALDAGETLSQETRRWDDLMGKSFVMRSKENALDYRYFPEPDLPVLHFTSQMDAEATALVGETIAMKIGRYTAEYGFNKEYVNGILSDSFVTKLFENSVAAWFDPKMIAKYIVNFILASTNTGTLDLSHTPFSIEAFWEFLNAVRDGKLTDNVAKNVMTRYLADWSDMHTLIAEAAANKVDTGALTAIIDDVLAHHKTVVDEYKGGKVTAIGFLMGQAMKQTRGSASPQEIQKLLEERLHADVD